MKEQMKWMLYTQNGVCDCEEAVTIRKRKQCGLYPSVFKLLLSVTSTRNQLILI